LSAGFLRALDAVFPLRERWGTRRGFRARQSFPVGLSARGIACGALKNIWILRTEPTFEEPAAAPIIKPC